MLQRIDGGLGPGNGMDVGEAIKKPLLIDTFGCLVNNCPNANARYKNNSVNVSR